MKMKLTVDGPDMGESGLGGGKEFEAELFFARVLKGGKGDPGLKGEPGIQGPKGEPGTDDVLVVPIDLTLPSEEREAAVMAVLQPSIDDGTFGRRPLFGEYIWKKNYDLPTASVYRMTVPATIQEGGIITLNYVFENQVNTYDVDYPGEAMRTEGMLTVLIRNNKVSYEERVHPYTNLQVIATENRMFDGTPEGLEIMFTPGQTMGLKRVVNGLEKGCDVALYYKTDAGLIPGYMTREKGTTDATKFVFTTGCQWISPNEAGELVFHTYKVVSDECNGRANDFFTLNGTCYRTDTVI